MSWGLLQGLGKGITNATEDVAQRLRDERLEEYKQKKVLDERAHAESLRPTNIRYGTDEQGNEVKISENAEGNILSQEQIREEPKDPQSSVGKMIADRERLATQNPDDPRLADFDIAIRNAASGKTSSVLPSSVREWEYYSSLGKDEQARYREMKRAQSVVDLGGSYGVFDAESGAINEVSGGAKTLAPHQTPGHAAEIETAKVLGRDKGSIEAGRPAAETALALGTSSGDAILSTLDGALDRVGALTSGLPGKISGVIPGTPAYDFKQDVTTIKANLGFDRLQAMRDSSPTGGALGQVSERELEYLQSTVANLDEGQSPAQLRKNIEKAKQHYLNWLEIQKAHHAMKYGSEQTGDSAGAGASQPSPPPRAPMAALKALYTNPDRIDDFVAKFGYKPEGF
ncbi:MAG: hypothetical protein M0Q95_17180 [Porticoccaceae bacterium]|nr:hypothetical protein [Porticoccaceae bacterium]